MHVQYTPIFPVLDRSSCINLLLRVTSCRCSMCFQHISVQQPRGCGTVGKLSSECATDWFACLQWFLSLLSLAIKSASQSDQSFSSSSDSSSESEYSTAMRRDRMVATSLPTGSLLACCSCCSCTFFSWMPVTMSLKVWWRQVADEWPDFQGSLTWKKPLALYYNDSSSLNDVNVISEGLIESVKLEGITLIVFKQTVTSLILEPV